MPEWLSFSNGVTVLSLIAASIAGLVAYRDKAFSRTITELRVIIDGLRIDVERITKREAEYRSIQEELNRNKEISDNRADSADAELEAIREVRSFRHWLYLPRDPLTGDPPKRNPICHVCYPKFGPIRMREELTTYITIYDGVDTTPTVAYRCDNCDKNFDVDPKEAKQLSKILMTVAE